MKRTYRSAGAIVVSSDPTNAATLLLEQVRSTGERQVVAPKGTIEAGESPLIAAQREVREEAGLTELMSVGFLGQQRYGFTDRDGEAAEKSVDWFLFASETWDVTPRTSEGFTGAEWLPLDKALQTASHAGFSRYLERAQDIISWRKPGRLAYSGVLSEVVWHIAHQASDLLGADADSGLALCGSAAQATSSPAGVTSTSSVGALILPLTFRQGWRSWQPKPRRPMASTRRFVWPTSTGRTPAAQGRSMT